MNESVEGNDSPQIETAASEAVQSSEHRDTTIPLWQRHEWNCIRQRREKAHGTKVNSNDYAHKPPEHLTGLSLSGGGIRSALFNDGFLQGLSHRGLLRYVDYLCSVSGGGYIAGHLACQARSDRQSADANSAESNDEPRSWHDAKAGELGRDRETGLVDPSRLAGIGGYLSRPFVFIPAYLWSFAFSLAFYLGLFGITSTLAALFWRSFDDIAFREIFGESLGFYQRGNELLIAFLPFLVLIATAIFVEGLLLVIRWSSRRSDPDAVETGLPKLDQFQATFRTWSLLGLLFAFLASLAIFLGNGKSSVSGGGEMIYLNRYAQVLAIIAASIQVLVFLGRDKLFRSESGSAKGWQRQLQQSVTAFVIFMTMFSMIHWMGRENISGYTYHRDPYLVVGDVTDWASLAAIHTEMRQSDKNAERSPAASIAERNSSVSYKNQKLKPDGLWRSSLASSRLGWPIDFVQDRDLSDPPIPVRRDDGSNSSGSPSSATPPQLGWMPEYLETPVESWGLFRRSLGGAFAYVRCMWGGKLWLLSDLFPMIESELANQDRRRASRRALVREFNQETIVQADLLRSLVAVAAGGAFQRNDNDASQRNGMDPIIPFLNPPKSTDQSTVLDFPKRLARHVDFSKTDLTSSEQQSIVRTVRLVLSDLDASGLTTQQRTADYGKSDFDRESAIVSSNRLLIEELFPGVIQSSRVASTFVVPPHDQITRRRWLVIWSTVLLVGLIGGLGPHRIRTVFHFYRNQLAGNFLAPATGVKRIVGDQSMSRVRPYLDGLPYPLILAAALRPMKRNGSYIVGSKPFLFTPDFVGSFEEGEKPIPADEIRFKNSRNAEALNLGDAVTLSGAAVTPLMTENRWLSGVMDFFNTGIGQWVWRTNPTKAKRRVAAPHPVATSLVLSLLVGLLCIWVLDLRLSALIAFSACGLLSYQWLCRIGSPGLIRSMLSARATIEDEKFNEHRNFYVADGGYQDYLGVSELLRRRCDLIVVSDAGANVGDDSLGTLARMCQRATHDFGIRFVDLDHESPIDFGRLEMNEDRLVHQPYICMRVRYPSQCRDRAKRLNNDDGLNETQSKEGLLVYCQMSITDSDPIEIKQIRNLFPSFPDEPTVNQFYNDKQVDAYRTLGYHIATRMCHELHRWDRSPLSTTISQQSKSGSGTEMVAPLDSCENAANDDTLDSQRVFHDCLTCGSMAVNSKVHPPSENANQQPYFDVLRERLLTGYRLACFEETSYQKDDLFAEAIWPSQTFAFPTFSIETNRLCDSIQHSQLADRWLYRYERNADIRSAYRSAIINDINNIGLNHQVFCAELWRHLDRSVIEGQPREGLKWQGLLGAHLTTIAVACQEIHRGRPHATFQVGGRNKLIDLCDRISGVIADQVGNVEQDFETMLRVQDRVIAELIEMERSVFQRGEHVSTISFAQCMNSLWGRMSRDQQGQAEETTLLNLGSKLIEFGSANESTPRRKRRALMNADALDLVSAETRQKLDFGLRKVDIGVLRNALIMTWYLGYLEKSDLEMLREKLASGTGPKTHQPSSKGSPPSQPNTQSVR